MKEFLESKYFLELLKKYKASDKEAEAKCFETIKSEILKKHENHNPWLEPSQESIDLCEYDVSEIEDMSYKARK